MDLMRELDPPCQRGCGRTFDECDEEEDGGQCAGSELVQRLERELAEAQAEVDRIRAVALDTHHQQELRWEDEHARLLAEVDGLRARVAKLETELGPTKEAADRWLKAYEELLAQRDRARNATRRLTSVLIANAHLLDVAFTNADGSPWSLYVKPSLERLRQALGMRWAPTPPAGGVAGTRAADPGEAP